MVCSNNLPHLDFMVLPSATADSITDSQEMMRKRRYCRVQKAMGDVSLLAGSPADAAEHYLTAVDLARTCSDTAWHGTALAGLASAKVLLLLFGVEHIKLATASHALHTGISCMTRSLG